MNACVYLAYIIGTYNNYSTVFYESCRDFSLRYQESVEEVV